MSIVSEMTQTIRSHLLDYPKVAFIHVPKCGGVSVYEAVFKSLYPAYLKGTNLVTNIDLKASKRVENLLDMDMMLARQVNLVSFMHRKHSLFVTGHCYAAPQVIESFCEDWQFITVLRSPVERFISEYIYNTYKSSDWHTNESSFEEYLQSYKAMRSGIGLCRYFSGLSIDEINQTSTQAITQIACKNLGRFSVVGRVEAMPEFEGDFQTSFGKSLKLQQHNASPNSELATTIRNTPKYIAQIKALCEKDIAIYEQVFA